MSNIFLALTGNGLARAVPTNGTWRVEHTLAGQRLTCLAANPHNSRIVYAGTHAGVLRSTDGGQTWLPAGLNGQIVKAIAVSKVDGSIYAGTKPPALFVSRDDGEHWTELEAFRQMRQWWWMSPAELPELTPYVQGIALSPSDANVIVIGIELGAVLRSEDGGKTWQRHRPGALRDCHSIMFHTTEGDWVYEGGGTGAGAAFSQNGGKKWRQPRTGLDRHYGWAVAADPAQPEIWYASLSTSPMKAHGQGDAQAHIFRSAGDAAWEKLEGGLPQPLNYMPYALVTDPAAPGHLYAGLSNGDVWQSTNHGDSWAQLPLKLGGIHQMLLLLETKE